MICRGVRGATTVARDTREDILEATRELLGAIAAANQIAADDVASIVFTATPDLKAVYPAEAARHMGWTGTALLCVQEMAVPGSLPRCIRVLLHWNTAKPAGELVHVYLREAVRLRPDLAQRATQATLNEEDRTS